MNHIKFAGLVSNWTYAYAKAYSDKLYEMGFCSKPVEIDDRFIVAYSHRTFSRNEVSTAFSQIVPEEGDGE